jgi:DNA-binding winged helix-turn-helix (wHTH) protein
MSAIGLPRSTNAATPLSGLHLSDMAIREDLVAPGSYRFEDFCLDPGDRQLRRGGQAVELNGRYFDALTLLVREQGRLVSKDRFLDEVWRGVPVTDEALTQCIRTLRRRLGDQAGNPRFIETVPKHGYRFIGPVERIGETAPRPRTTSSKQDMVTLGVAGTAGGAVAGIIGGLFYGLIAASEPSEPGVGAVSILLVLLILTTFVASLGAAGVAFGLALSGYPDRESGPLTVAGGALGGLAVGAIVKFLSLDAFSLFIGRSPGEITGPFEGALIGTAVGFAAWLTTRKPRWSLRWSSALAALAGGLAGIMIPLLGGHMMGGSLHGLVRQFPGSQLRLDQLGAWFGESGFGPVTATTMGGIEGALFGSCVVAAMLLVRRYALAAATR